MGRAAFRLRRCDECSLVNIGGHYWLMGGSDENELVRFIPVITDTGLDNQGNGEFSGSRHP
jgi:hypothetical protein